MKTYTIGNNALKTDNELVLIDDYYMEKKVYNHLENHIRERILTDNRIAAREADRYWAERYKLIKENRKNKIKNTIMTTVVLFGFFMLVFAMLLHGLMC